MYWIIFSSIPIDEGRTCVNYI